MRPVTVISGILMASTVAVALGLVVVIIIYLIIGDDAPSVRREIPTLWLNAGIFAAFSAIGVASFWGQVKERRWWPVAVTAQLIALAVVTVYYWP